MRCLPAALAAVSLTAAPALHAQTAGAPWDWQLQEPFALSNPVATMDLDPDAVTAEEVAELKARGVFTICYVSVGTREDWRTDAGAFPAAVLGRPYEAWPGETFLDVRRLDVLLPIMAARFDRCAAKGFDGVEPDNMDVHVNDSGFPLSEDDAVAYVAALAEVADGMGLAIGQKNVPELTPRLQPILDFAVAEDCLTDGWCDALAPYAAAGKAILAAEYHVPEADRPAACAAARAAGLSMIFKTLALDGSGARCD